jgi:hypothetical protein
LNSRCHPGELVPIASRKLQGQYPRSEPTILGAGYAETRRRRVILGVYLFTHRVLLSYVYNSDCRACFKVRVT